MATYRPTKNGSFHTQLYTQPVIAYLRKKTILITALFLLFSNCECLVSSSWNAPDDSGFTYTSTALGDRLVQRPAVWAKSSTYADIALLFDTSVRLQTIEGFGGAFTEASAYNYLKLSPTDRARVMELYFGCKTGNKYNMGRVPMNSCDFSPSSYSFDDNGGIPDPSLEHFDNTAAVDMQNGIIPMIMDAQKVIEQCKGDPLEIFGSPWSPPQWMKLNDHPMVGSDVPCLKSDMHGVWADYFVKWINAYKSRGIKIWGMTAQNEPGFIDNTKWEACTFTAEQQRDFIRDYLGPRLQDLGVKLMAYDDDKSQLNEWADIILGDSTTAQYVWGMGLHWYTGDYLDNLAYVRDTYPGVAQLATEGCTCIYDRVTYNTTWKRAHRYVHDALADFNNGVVGWIDWNLLLDTSGPFGTGGPNHANNTCFAHMHVLKNGTLVVQDSFYTFGHLTRFIPRGSRVLSHSLQKGPVLGVEGCVFELPNGSIVAVVANPTSVARSLSLRAQGWMSAVIVDAAAESVVTVVLQAIEILQR